MLGSFKIPPSPRSTPGTSALIEFQSHGNLTPLVTLQLSAFYRPEKQNKPRKMSSPACMQSHTPSVLTELPLVSSGTQGRMWDRSFLLR